MIRPNACVEVSSKHQLLDKTIKYVWMNNIQIDYNSGYIINEDTLKNALYFHLRTIFESDSRFENHRIYTECTGYGFSSIDTRPDMIIVDGKTDKIVAVFELKYKSKECYRVEDLVIKDSRKLRMYMKKLDTLHNKCQYYIAAITLGEFNRVNWLDGRSKWAIGRVAELIAYGSNSKVNFNIISHNE